MTSEDSTPGFTQEREKIRIDALTIGNANSVTASFVFDVASVHNQARGEMSRDLRRHIDIRTAVQNQRRDGHSGEIATKVRIRPCASTLDGRAQRRLTGEKRIPVQHAA